MDKHKILIVDDDTRVLAGYKRTLSNDYDILLADNPIDALNIIKLNKDIAVVISDFMMPKMDGNMFFDITKEIIPDTIRILLTGNGDFSVAIDAINKSHIDKFLVKPCLPSQMKEILSEAVKQFEKKFDEKEKLRKTFEGGIKMVMQMIELTNPTLYIIAKRASNMAKTLLPYLKFRDGNEEDAVFLSFIGAVTLPEKIFGKIYAGVDLSDEDMELFKTYPSISSKLLSSVPEFTKIGEAVSYIHLTYLESTAIRNKGMIFLSRVIKICTDYATLERRYLSPKKVIDIMKKNIMIYDPDLFRVLEQHIKSDEEEYKVKEITLPNVKEGMSIAKDIFDDKGVLILAKNSFVNDIIYLKILNFVKYNSQQAKYMKVLIKI
ncbi:response regulator [bacterium]|nr:response regulator [bacterium]